MKADAKLAKAGDGVFRLLSGSAAIDKAASVSAYSFIKLDVDGQSRAGALDIGADEFSSAAPVHVPLTPKMVGPAAP